MAFSLRRLLGPGLWAFVSLGFGGFAAEDVITEDFESGAPAELHLIGTAQVLEDDGCQNAVLSLTQGANNQGGWAWFEQEFDLAAKRVEIEFDLFIGAGTSGDPADGVSVIFQFRGDMKATGDAGGGLGVGNLNGNEYVSVGFDIWDNGAVDIETTCDTGNRSCHVEVDQNIDPEDTPSQVAAQAPDYIRSAAIYRQFGSTDMFVGENV